MNILFINKVKTSILRGDKTYKGIDLPKVQTSGTVTQIEAHARQQATKIYKGLESSMNLAKARLKQAKETGISSYIDEASIDLDNISKFLEE